jgi:hypothetical protein
MIICHTRSGGAAISVDAVTRLKALRDAVSPV